MKIVDLPKKSTQETVALLEEWLAQARNGDFESISIIAYRTDKSWQTGASSTTDCMRDVSMLFELAIRRLGFLQRSST